MRILIEVRGGAVQAITADEKLSVHLLDYDCLPDRGRPRPQLRPQLRILSRPDFTREINEMLTQLQGTPPNLLRMLESEGAQPSTPNPQPTSDSPHPIPLSGPSAHQR